MSCRAATSGSCRGDRVVVIGSPDAARAWSRRRARGSDERIDDVVIFGAGRMGTTIARVLLERGMRAAARRRAARARRARCAEAMPDVRCFHAQAFDPEFLERERIGRATAAVFCLNDDAKNLYGAVLAKGHGVRMTIALVHDPVSVEVYERGGVDVAVNPRQVTAEEMVRFAHDPRIRQIAMLEGDRFEVLDLTVRAESELVDKPFKELPVTGSQIGAVIRNGSVIFPHGSDIAARGRPRDHLRGVQARVGGRAGAVTRAQPAGTPSSAITAVATRCRGHRRGVGAVVVRTPGSAPWRRSSPASSSSSCMAAACSAV